MQQGSPHRLSTEQLARHDEVGHYIQSVCRPYRMLLRPDYAPVSSSILQPVADVVLGRVVVPAIYLPKPRTVKVHRDGWRSGRVTHPVNAPLVRQHARDPIFTSPLEPPELVQAGIVSQGAIVGTLVALFKNGSQDATEGSPGGMVVDPGPGTRRPDENLQRVGMVGIVLAIGHIPVLGPSC